MWSEQAEMRARIADLLGVEIPADDRPVWNVITNITAALLDLITAPAETAPAETAPAETAPAETAPAAWPVRYERKFVCCSRPRCGTCGGERHAHGPYWYAIYTHPQTGRRRYEYKGRDFTPPDEREPQVLAAVAAGATSSSDVAERTGLSLATVIYAAGNLVRNGKLRALDGKPWQVLGESDAGCRAVVPGVAAQRRGGNFVVRVALEDLEPTGIMQRYADDWGPIRERVVALAQRTRAALLAGVPAADPAAIPPVAEEQPGAVPAAEPVLSFTCTETSIREPGVHRDPDPEHPRPWEEQAPAACGKPSDGKKSPYLCRLPSGHTGKHAYALPTAAEQPGAATATAKGRARTVLACNVQAPSGGNRGPRRCARPVGHAGKHHYIEHPQVNGRHRVPAPAADSAPIPAVADTLASSAPAADSAPHTCPGCEANPAADPLGLDHDPALSAPGEVPAADLARDSNPLDHRCPQCKAQPGVRCKNYKNRGCAPHRERRALAEIRARYPKEDRDAAAEGPGHAAGGRAEAAGGGTEPAGPQQLDRGRGTGQEGTADRGAGGEPAVGGAGPEQSESDLTPPEPLVKGLLAAVRGAGLGEGLIAYRDAPPLTEPAQSVCSECNGPCPSGMDLCASCQRDLGELEERAVVLAREDEPVRLRAANAGDLARFADRLEWPSMSAARVRHLWRIYRAEFDTLRAKNPKPPKQKPPQHRPVQQGLPEIQTTIQPRGSICPRCQKGQGEVHACCPTCPARAVGEAEVEKTFGTRRMGGKLWAQSACRLCRNRRSAEKRAEERAARAQESATPCT